MNSKERISSSTIELNEYDSLSQGWLRGQRSNRHQIYWNYLVSNIHIKDTECKAEMQKNTSEYYNGKSLSYALIKNPSLLLLFRSLKYWFFIFTLDFITIWDFIGLQFNRLLLLVIQIFILWIFNFCNLSHFLNSCCNYWGYLWFYFCFIIKKIQFNNKRRWFCLFLFYQKLFYSLRSVLFEYLPWKWSNNYFILRLINYINCCSLEGLKEGKFTN